MKVCKIVCCDKKSVLHDMCRSHHRKWLLYGNPLETQKKKGKKKNFCSVEFCDKPSRAYGLCSMHDARMQKHGDVHYTPPTKTPEERYHSFYTKGEPDSCWPWGKGCDKNGYGKFTIHHGVHIRAHRFGWILLHGPIPEGMLICHTCDNPPCQNPAHWFPGTHKDNMQDKVKKGRLVSNPYRNARGNRYASKPTTLSA